MNRAKVIRLLRQLLSELEDDKPSLDETGNAARCRRQRLKKKALQGMSPPMSNHVGNHVDRHGVNHVGPMSQGMSQGEVAPLSLSLDSFSSHSFPLSAEDLPQPAGAGAREANGETMSLPMSRDMPGDHVANGHVATHVANDMPPKRKKYQHPETQVPRVDAPSEEVEAFCAKWKLPPPSDPRVKEFLRVYRQNERYWRNWNLVWAGFLAREQKWNGNGSRQVQGMPAQKPAWAKDF